MFAYDGYYPSSVPLYKHDFGLRFALAGWFDLTGYSDAGATCYYRKIITFCTGMVISNFNSEDSHLINRRLCLRKMLGRIWKFRWRIDSLITSFQVHVGGLVQKIEETRKRSRKPGNLPIVSSLIVGVPCLHQKVIKYSIANRTATYCT